MQKSVQIIGVPLDLGQSRRGVDMGPSAIRYAGLASRLQKLGFAVQDYGNILVPVREHLPQKDSPGYASEIETVCSEIYQIGCEALQKEALPLFLGGDHSIAVGTIAAVTDQSPCGVIWIDGHGDFNLPETSPNGNIHGMPVSILLGYGLQNLIDVGRRGPKLKPDEIVLIGTRDLDYDERNLLKSSGIRIYTMREIDERGIAAVTRESLHLLSHLPSVHVSLDMDALDPIVGPGVGTPAPGGLSYREAHLLMSMVHDSGKLRSMDIVEINPILDNKNMTAKVAVELAASLLGEKIL
ncbi:MAG TPA: arginase [Chitinispirillaceae bacterium]|nr:arginase [Chitinispirillaceae bacterium]